jgi:ubiquinone/menaquinone biosynthesis C-methylase UbiE
MDIYTDKTKPFLEERFGEMVDGVYFSHQPIYGYRSKYSATSNISRYIITRSILNAINEYSFDTFIDIGGAEGYTAYLVRELFKAKVMSTDLSENACKMAKEIFKIDALACDIHQLPFQDEGFDIVLCSETIEHVTDYKLAIKELLRITKNVLIITVPHESPEEVEANIRNNVPHGHINYFETVTLDYLKKEGYTLKAEKTLSPFLVVPRVMAEATNKANNNPVYKIYNFFTPVLRKVFGANTATNLVNADAWYCRSFKKYSGITFVIEKKKPLLKRTFEKGISANDFICKKVDLFRTASRIQQ